MVEAWEKEDERLLNREATWTACLMNATGNFKEPITVDQLVRGKDAAHELDMEKIRQRAEERKQERLKQRKEREKTNG